MRRATPRAWRCGAACALVLAATLGASPGAVAQDEPPLVVPANPLEPTGRAVCNLAFTLSGALGLTSFVVPPGAGLDVNQVIVALRPVLDLCVGVFPPAPARQCVTADLYPSTGLPITLPDPVGILTEQAEALVAALGPPGLALSGPLHDVFVTALRCQDLAAAPGGDEEAGGPVIQAPASPTGPGLTAAVDGLVPRVTAPATEVAVAAPDAVDLPVAGPSASLVSVVPAPLRGVAVVATTVFVAGCASAFRRLLSPRRRASVLEPGAPQRP